LVQLSESRSQQHKMRFAAVSALRRAAQQFHEPRLSILATSVQLDAFTKVKKAIDDMVSMLEMQQGDEVKKSDWCKAELQENEMATARTTDEKGALEAKIADLESSMKSLQDGIADGHKQIAQLQLELQRATEDRKIENHDFQKTVADQTTTIEVLHKALDKLAKYYDLVQVKASGSRQTPPVPQMEYKPNQGSSSVMEMIEKLIHDAQKLMADSKKSESDAQAAYEQIIADTNASVEAAQKEVVTKSKAHAKANKDKMEAESDLSDTVKELDGLAKYNLDMHKECDYVLKNFDVRQTARAQEIEALRQVKQILSGASLN
jgi:chromosome segregation ATPase